MILGPHDREHAHVVPAGPTCPRCGYDLRAATALKCTECGEPIDYGESRRVNDARRGIHVSIRVMLLTVLIPPVMIGLGGGMLNGWFSRGGSSWLLGAPAVCLALIAPFVLISLGAALYSDSAQTLRRFRGRQPVTAPRSRAESLRHAILVATLLAAQFAALVTLFLIWMPRLWRVGSRWGYWLR